MIIRSKEIHVYASLLSLCLYMLLRNKKKNMYIHSSPNIFFFDFDFDFVCQDVAHTHICEIMSLEDHVEYKKKHVQI